MIGNGKLPAQETEITGGKHARTVIRSFHVPETVPLCDAFGHHHDIYVHLQYCGRFFYLEFCGEDGLRRSESHYAPADAAQHVRVHVRHRRKCHCGPASGGEEKKRSGPGLLAAGLVHSGGGNGADADRSDLSSGHRPEDGGGRCHVRHLYHLRPDQSVLHAVLHTAGGLSEFL